MEKEQNILATEKVPKLLFKLAIPAVISQLVNMLYNIIDRMYIGHIPDIGVHALTGVGLCFPILMLVTAFSSFFGMGGAPRAAIEMGRGDNEKAEQILGNCVTALIAIAITLTVILLFFGKDLLYLFGSSEDTILYSWNYIKIYALGTIFVQISLGLNAFITTQGFTTYSMLTVLIGAFLNIILDPIFIFVFDLDVKGAALATIISQAVSAVWVLKFLTGKKTTLKIKVKNLKLTPDVLFPIMALGVSPFIMQSTESLLNICFNVSLQKYGGDLAVGAMTISTSLMQMFITPMQGVAQGAQPIISYNYGALNKDRVIKTLKLEIIFIVIVCFLYWALIQINPALLISVFTSDPELIEFTSWSVRIYMGCSFMIALQICCQQSFVALGQAKISLLLACLRKIILLIPLIFILPNIFEDKVFAVFIAEPVSDFLAASITFLVFIFSINKILDSKVNR